MKSDKKFKRKVGVLGVLGTVIMMVFLPIAQAAPVWGTDVEDDDSYYISIDDNGDTGDDQAFAVSKHGKPGVGTELLRLEETGRLGIGDTSPDFKLEVTGSSGSGYFGVTSSTDGDIFIIDSSGNVGIGTTSPDAKLDVEVSSGGAAEIGYSCSATGNTAIAMGSGTKASGSDSMAIGFCTEATNSASFATGVFSSASGQCSFAAGNANASGDCAASIGWLTVASGDLSFAMGSLVQATEDCSMVLGRGDSAGGTDLINNIPYSLMIGFDSNTPTVFVDGSSVGIGGTTTPVGAFNIDTTGESKGLGVVVDTYHVQTTSATATTIATISTGTNRVYGLTVTIVGIESNGDDSAHYIRHASYENDDGTLTELVEATEHTAESNVNWDVTIGPSGTDIVIQVIGVTLTTIEWQATVEMNIVGV